MEQEVDSDVEIVESNWLGSSSDVLKNNGVDSSLSYVCRREYTIECNWKVQSILCLIFLPYSITALKLQFEFSLLKSSCRSFVTTT